MAAASPVLQLGLLYMRPIQFWLKQRVPSIAWRHRRHRVTVTLACVSALARWRDLFWLKQENEPRSRHVVEEQYLFRGMNTPPGTRSRFREFGKSLARLKWTSSPPKTTPTAQSFLQGVRMPWPMNGSAFRSMLSPSRSATACTLPPSGGTNRGCLSYSSC